MDEFEITKNLQAFNSRLLSYLQERKKCDVEIVINGERISAHSIILAGSSDYFEMNLLDSSDALSEHVVENVDTEITKLLIEFCYTNSMKVKRKDLLKVLENAQALIMTSVVEDCCRILKSIINSENCCEMWTTAQRLQVANLEDFALEHICRNYQKMSQTDSFLKLQPTELENILKCNLYVCSEVDVFDSVKRWLNHDIEKRSEHLMTMLKQVRLELLPYNILVSESQNLCKTNAECLGLTMTAIQKQINKESIETEARKHPETMVVFGGYEMHQGEIVDVYNMNEGSWTNFDRQIQKALFSCELVQDEFFVIGGSGKKFTHLNTVESYNVKTWRKKSLAPLNIKRFASASAVVDSCIYVLGGEGLENKSIATCERYDPVTNQWSLLEPMPTARCYHGAAAIGTDIYVIGGRDTTSNELSHNECYSVSRKKWRTCASMQEKRMSLGVAALKGFVYAVGGYRGADLSTVERYNPKLNRWNYVQSLSMPRSYIGAGTFCENLVIAGGWEGKYITKVEQYDPEND